MSEGTRFGHRRGGTAEQDPDRAGFDVVVLDRERAGTVRAHDGVRLDASQLDAGEAAAADGRLGAVQRQPVLGRGVGLENTAIEDEIARELRDVSRDRVAQRDDVALAGASGEPNTVESPVCGVADGAEGRRAVRRAEGGEIRRRVDACVGQGQPARAHGDRRRSVLDRQRVVARERGSGVQFKDVAWERGVEGGLEVRARGHTGLRQDRRG